MTDQSAEGRLKSMQLFYFRCSLLRKGGTIVLFGTQTAAEYEHLQPVHRSTWKNCSGSLAVSLQGEATLCQN